MVAPLALSLVSESVDLWIIDADLVRRAHLEFCMEWSGCYLRRAVWFWMKFSDRSGVLVADIGNGWICVRRVLDQGVKIPLGIVMVDARMTIIRSR